MIETAVFGVFHRATDRVCPSNASRLANAAPSALSRDSSYGSTSPQHAGCAKPGPSEVSPSSIVRETDTGSPSNPGSETSLTVVAACQADQLGLAHPTAISLKARLPGSESIELHPSGSGLYRPSGVHAAVRPVVVRNEASNTQLGLAAGTRVLTSRGETEVNELASGDVVLALRGPALVPVLRVDRGHVAGVSIAIAANAFGPDLPRRLLRVGHDQPIFLAPTPVAAHTLVNGDTIRLVDDAIELFCVSLGTTDILLAEGMPLASVDQVSAQLN